MPSKNMFVVLILVVAALAMASAWVGVSIFLTPPASCSSDTLQCPDGSFVGRNPDSDCSFFPCPVVDYMNNEGNGNGNDDGINGDDLENAVHITTVSLPNGEVGSSYSATVSASGGETPYVWDSVGLLPDGLAINSNTGTINGTPTIAGARSFTIMVGDNLGETDMAFLSIIIESAGGGGGIGDDGDNGDDSNAAGSSLSISTVSLPSAYETVNYSNALQASGGNPPYAWSKTGTMPTGLTLSSSGIISGTPSKEETKTVTISVEDNEGDTVSKSFTIIVFNTESNLGTLFVPNSFVPLSPFISSFPSGTNYAIILPVRKEILSFLSDENITAEIACKNGSSIAYNDISYVDEEEGLVVFETDQTGDCAVIADSPDGFFENDFPIVTHWKASVNNGRGGFELGASELLPYSDNDTSGDPLNIYYYTDDYAIFADDPNTRLPTFGNGMGENFAVARIADLNAVKDSDNVLTASGYPVVHKNYPWALDANSPIEKQIHENVPSFQIAHAYLIENQPGESSLASFLLPPNWVKNPAKKYPVLFNGFYDIHGSSYATYGTRFMRIIGELINDGGGSAMGILWNDNGASSSLHLSELRNASLLFSTAESLLGADKQNIIMTGGSRGGGVTLRLASNPLDTTGYRVKLAIAYAPPVKFGDHALDYSDTTYNGVSMVLTGATGYRFSWQLGWEDPETQLPGRELFLQNSIGTTDQTTANNISVWGDTYVNALKSKGTKVILSVSSHDHFIPLNLEVEYADKLREAGVPLQFRFNYRFGHSDLQYDLDELLTTAMREILSGNPVSLTEGTFHYRRESETNYNTAVQFYPTSQPIVFEGPKLAAWGERNSFVFVGGNGDQIDLRVYKIDDDSWISSYTIVEQGQSAFFSQSLTLSSSNPIATAVNHLTIPTDGSVPAGYYLYKLYFARPGQTQFIMIPPSAIPQPSAPKQPVFLILPNEIPSVSGTDLMALSEDGRAWGLASDTID